MNEFKFVSKKLKNKITNITSQDSLSEEEINKKCKKWEQMVDAALLKVENNLLNKLSKIIQKVENEHFEEEMNHNKLEILKNIASKT